MRIMTTAQRLTLLLLATGASLLHPAEDRERGDVPGWVMITLMSAVLVAALLAIAGPALEGLFNQAIDQVSP
jgi:ABC-type transport system involved in cytochrome c biogenesis permease subunit